MILKRRVISLAMQKEINKRASSVRLQARRRVHVFKTILPDHRTRLGRGSSHLMGGAKPDSLGS